MSLSPLPAPESKRRSSFTDNAPGSPHTVALTGTGLSPAPTPPPNAHTNSHANADSDTDPTPTGRTKLPLDVRS